MSKYTFEFLVLLVLLVGFMPLLAASKDRPAEALPKAIVDHAGMLTILVNPQLELLAVVQYLSGSKMVFQDGTYADAIEAWFGEYKNHPIVQRLRDMEECGFAYDLPVSSFLRFEDLSFSRTHLRWEPSSETMNLHRLEYVTQAGTMDEFYDMLGQFALETDFAGFFASQRPYLQKKVEDAVNAFSQYPDMIAHMTEWYGYSHASYNLVISPLVEGGYGPALMDDEGGIHAYCVVNIDCSKFTDKELLELSSWLFHEFSHSYVNPLVDQYWSLFESAEELYQIIQDKMYHAYSSWWVVVAEHLVRVNAHRLSELYFHNENAGVLQSEVDSGFLFIQAAYEAILQYEEEHKQKGRHYAEYFPSIAHYFMDKTEISEEEIARLMAFRGPMNSVYSGVVLIIYPDPDRVSGVKEYIMPTVDWMVKNKEGWEAVSDQDALDMDLSNKALCLYGAWGTNLILEKFKQDLPFEIYPDRIVADKIYEGTQLRIALCLPNPLNNRLGMCIYTAQSIEAMKDANAIFHGPEDWYVSDSDLNVLGSGSFKNKDERWSF